MKRVVPSLLVCLLTLLSGPGLRMTTLPELLATLHGADPAQALLPACCRRNGAHHCAMQMAQMSATENAEHNRRAAFSTPDTCPCFPRTLARSAPETPAVLTAAILLSGQVATDNLARIRLLSVHARWLSLRADRGPPATSQI